jgi:hypothetical protein
MTKLGNALRAAALAAAALAATAAGAQAPIEATTGSGERVLLHPDGRWEYAHPKKRAESPRPPPPVAQPAAAPGQGGLLGVGRTIPPGDPEYNRGSLSGKGR